MHLPREPVRVEGNRACERGAQNSWGLVSRPWPAGACPLHARDALGGAMSTPSICNSCIFEKNRVSIMFRNSTADDRVPVTLNEVGRGCAVAGQGGDPGVNQLS